MLGALQTNVEAESPGLMSSECEDKLRRLLGVGRVLVRDLDPETVLPRILEEARGVRSFPNRSCGGRRMNRRSRRTQTEHMSQHHLSGSLSDRVKEDPCLKQ